MGKALSNPRRDPRLSHSHAYKINKISLVGLCSSRGGVIDGSIS